MEGWYPDVVYRRERKIGHGHAPKKQTIRMKESESIEDRFCPASGAFPCSHPPRAQGSGSIKVSEILPQKFHSSQIQIEVLLLKALDLAFYQKFLVALPVRLFRGSLVRGGGKKSAVKKAPREGEGEADPNLLFWPSDTTDSK